MNIIVTPLSGDNYYFKSDSTLVRGLSDFYIPDYVKSLDVIPVIVFKVGRPGKMIAERFAHRYISAFTYGLLIDCSLNQEDYGKYAPFVAASMDYTTQIPNITFPMEEYAGRSAHKSPLTLYSNGATLLEWSGPFPLELLYRGISAITKYASVRTGDFVAFELSAPVTVASEEKIVLSDNIIRYAEFLIH